MKSPKFHPWFQSLAIAVVRVTFKLFYGYRVIGRENAPEGACVVVSNHVQNSDPCFIVISTGNSTLYRAMGKKELFEIPFVNRLVTWLGAFPVDRGKADMNAIRSALRTYFREKGHTVPPMGWWLPLLKLRLGLVSPPSPRPADDPNPQDDFFD